MNTDENKNDDVSFEPDNDLDRGGRDAQEIIKKLKEKLATSEKERHEYLDGWQRAKADLINARKRDEEDRKAFVKRANEGLIESLIPVLESFDMAMSNKEAWEKVDKNWRVGVEYIANQLKKALNDEGLEELNPLGQDFDITKHETTGHKVVSDKKDAGKVIEVVQRGYALHDKILKAPRVIVGESKE